jgi:twitching motility protein PilT
MDYARELDELLDIVIKESASDLHLSEGRKPTIRVTGELVTLIRKDEVTGDYITGILNVLLKRSPHLLEHFQKENEVDFAYSHGQGNRFRGNAFVQQGHTSIALRLIPNIIKQLADLNLPPALEQFARKQQGFFLVVGPVGQGKTTTLAALIELINQERAEHIVTIENPIEYVYAQKKSIIDQREVGIDTRDFATALRSALRQDVNVILVGEMRDHETMAAAVTAAETGHLVFSTLHTNNAAQTIDRIIDSFPSSQQDQIRMQLASSLSGILSQRLVPRVSGGQLPAFELLIANNAVANLIREKRTHELNTVIETGSDQGMVDMNRCLIELVRKGEISVETAYQHSLNPKVLERML